jgi:PAS domain S-box-containing protein
MLAEDFDRSAGGVETAVVWSVDDGRVVSATPAFCELVGWSQEELVGRSAGELGLRVEASASGAARDSGSPTAVGGLVTLATSSGTPVVVEARSLLMSLRGERLTFVVIEQAPQEQGLAELMLDGVPLAIMLLDCDLRVVRVNTRAETMLGATELHSQGRGFRDVLPTTTAELDDELRGILAGGLPRLGIETSLPPARFLASYFPVLAPNGAVNGVGCLFADITEQREAEDALHDSEENRRLILGQMLRVEELERSRIALDLHDDTIQVLAASLLMTDGVIGLATRHNETEIASRLRTARQVLESATERARRLMFELHPTLLDQRGLRPALTAFTEQVGAQMHATWSVDVPDVRYSWEVETLAFRIIRESLTNVRKHSKAKHFSVDLVEREHRLYGVVRDDGRGFDVDQVANEDQPLHVGLQSLDERLNLAGGELRMTSPGGTGTQVSFWLPLSRDDEEPGVLRVPAGVEDADGLGRRPPVLRRQFRSTGLKSRPPASR